MTETLPAHRAVYETLRARILGGELAPGAVLTLRGVAAELGVSMTPAREAVRRLAAERALTLSASGRIAVPDPGPEALEELFAIRLMIEPELARRACPETPDHALETIRETDHALTTAIADGDAAAYVRLNLQFHARLYAPAPAPAMKALIESVWLQTAPALRRVYGRLGTGSAETDFHEAAIGALAARDAEALAAAIRADVAQGARLAAAGLDRPDL